MSRKKLVFKYVLSVSALISSVFLFLNLQIVFYLVCIFQLFVVLTNYVDFRKTKNIKELILLNLIQIFSNVCATVIYKIWFDNTFPDIKGDTLIFKILINNPSANIYFLLSLKIVSIIYCQCLALNSLKNSEKLSVSLIIMSLLFSGSVFVLYLPFEISICLKLILLILQPLFAVLYCFTIKKLRWCIIFNIILLLSNIANLFWIVEVWASDRLNNTANLNANNPGGWVILTGDLLFCSIIVCFVTYVTIAVFVVCVESIICKIFYFCKKDKLKKKHI